MKKYINEFIGTLLLVFLGCGIAVVTHGDIMTTSLGFGLAFIVISYLFKDCQRVHINPAVSMAMYITNKINFKQMLAYIFFELLGALYGSLFLGICLGSFTNLGANGFGGAYLATSPYIALFIETILTLVFVLTILVSNKKKNSILIGGLSLTLVHLLGIPFTGTSVNPARSLAPALLEIDALSSVWVFIVGPLIGAILAAIIYEAFIKNNDD